MSALLQHPWYKIIIDSQQWLVQLEANTGLVGEQNATIYDQNVNLRLCSLTEIFIEYKVACSQKNIVVTER